MDVAKSLDVAPAQLAIAWCSVNPQVSTVITGASRVEQVHENMKALAVLPKINSEVIHRLNGIFGELGSK